MVAALVIVATAAAFTYFKYYGRGPQAITSIAVLPFVNEGADQNMEYLSDGLSESLINALSRLPRLKVSARSSVFRYRGKDANLREIATELGVQAVLVGRVAQQGDSLVVSAALVDARDETQVWGDRYERRIADLLSVQLEIVKEITNKLRLTLSSTEQSRLTQSYTEIPEAYRLYLRGRFYWNKRTEESVRKGIEFFRQAVEKDPKFALAYVGVADSYILLGVQEALTGAMPTRESLIAARSAAERALALDDTLAEAHSSLAHAKYIGREWAGAEEGYKRAIELNPNYATTSTRFTCPIWAGTKKPKGRSVGRWSSIRSRSSSTLTSNLSCTSPAATAKRRSSAGERSIWTRPLLSHTTGWARFMSSRGRLRKPSLSCAGRSPTRTATRPL